MSCVYIHHQDHNCTLTTYLYVSLWMLWKAEQENLKGYINWPAGLSVIDYHDAEMFRKVPNQYNWYFKQPYFDQVPEGSHRVWMWGQMDVGQFFSQSLADIKAFYKKHLKFNDEVNRRGQELVDKYQIDFSKTIGLTWRGTDIHLDKRPYLPIEVYFPWIDDILNEHPDYRIICTAEEAQILDPLLKKYNAVVIEEFEQAPKGSKQNPERFSSRSGYERGLQPVLMVWLFSKCAHYIKNRSSTGAVASWLSDGSITTLGCDERLTTWDGTRPFAEIAERDGIQYPLYR